MRILPASTTGVLRMNHGLRQRMKLELRSPVRMALVVFLLGWLAVSAAAESSALWGEYGDDWNPSGPLPDFSFAGYQFGERPIPNREPDVSVADFGAMGDGVTDDTAAFLKAIEESPGKVIAVPPGRFVITDQLTIRKNGTVLKGAGSRESILVCPKPLEEINPRPLTNHSAKTVYSWSGGIVWLRGNSFGRENLADIAPTAKRGESTIELSTEADLKLHQPVIIHLESESTGSGAETRNAFLEYLYAGDAGNISTYAGKSAARQQVCRVVAVDGAKITLDRPLRYDLRAEFNPQLRKFDPTLEEAGVEGLGFEFPERDYAGHFSEAGYNAISIQQGVHCWARDIYVNNCDSGIFLAYTRFCTVDHVVIESSRTPDPKHDSTGHHAIQVVGEDNLVSNFDIRTKFIHDITVDVTTGCVFRNGKGVDMSLDHHRNAAYANLFSNIDMGEGTRAFFSGGSAGKGHHAGARNTYWRLTSKERIAWPENFGPARQNWIGVNTRERKSDDADGRWIETIGPNDLKPAELHQSQLSNRLTTWTLPDGRVVRASFINLDGDKLVVQPPNGRNVSVELKRLSAQSRAQALRLGANPGNN